MSFCKRARWSGVWVATALGCAGSQAGETSQPKRARLIAFSPMYSAFDGEHDSQLTPSVPLMAADARARSSDPLELGSLRWQLDGSFVAREDFDALPGALLLTTRKPGATHVRVTARTQRGRQLLDDAELIISEARADEWALGQLRFERGVRLEINRLRPITEAHGRRRRLNWTLLDRAGSGARRAQHPSRARPCGDWQSRARAVTALARTSSRLTPSASAEPGLERDFHIRRLLAAVSGATTHVVPRFTSAAALGQLVSVRACAVDFKARRAMMVRSRNSRENLV